MEYQNQNSMARTATMPVGRLDAPPAMRDVPRLQQQIVQLEKVLSGCHEIASGIERAADRITGPVPQGVGETSGKPPTDTLERRLADAIGYAEGLHGRLMHAMERLNQAV